MKKIPDNTRIVLSYNLLGQLGASWFFEHEGKPYGATRMDINETLDPVFNAIKDTYQIALIGGKE